MNNITPEWKQLYIAIRRLHRKLPPSLQFLGNRYVYDEFARHRQAKQDYIPSFFKAWRAYKDELESQISKMQVGRKLREGELESLNDSQIGQLYALKTAAKDPPIVKKDDKK